MLDSLPLTSIAVLLALIEYLYFALTVGAKRSTLGVAAPAVSGNEEWERYYRVQQNTLEQLIVMVPAALVFGTFIGDLWAAAAVVVFIIGRIVYFAAYTRDPAKRGTGMMITFVANLVLLIGGLIGAVLALLG